MSSRPNGADIATLVLAVVLPLLGFVLGLVRRSQWRAGGAAQPTLVTVAIVLGAVLTSGQLLALVGIAAYIGFTASGVQ